MLLSGPDETPADEDGDRVSFVRRRLLSLAACRVAPTVERRKPTPDFPVSLRDRSQMQRMNRLAVGQQLKLWHQDSFQTLGAKRHTLLPGSTLYRCIQSARSADF